MKKQIVLLIVMCISIFFVACENKSNEVIVYTAVDEVFSEGVIKEFEEKTGIDVKVVYDTESNKTTGLVNRIIAEKDHPICDVFWNNEFMQTIALCEEGMLGEYVSPEADTIPEYYKSSEGMWTAFGGRARVLLVNNERLDTENFPTTVLDFTNERYSGEELAIAYPMFGTTKTMAAALYAQWGEEEGREYFQKIADKKVNIVDGNSVTKDMAVSGEVAIGFTDSDDAREAIGDGANVTMIYPDQGKDEMGTLLTPSTVAIIRNAPNEKNAQIFVDFILSETVEKQLVEDGFFDISVRKNNMETEIKGMTISLEDIYKYMDIAAKDMEEIFSKAE